MTHPRRLAAAALCALAVAATRAPFLARALDDVDSVNFALALRDFDPALHQPHPPGFAVFVVLGKLSAAVTGAGPARALALVSLASQALLPLPLFVLFRRLGASPAVSAAAAVLTLVNPVVWINGLRPMSDSAGLLFAVAAQAALLAAAGERGLRRSSLLAGLAAGVRIQTLALTLPAWARAWARAGGRARMQAVVALVAGLLAWAIPTVLESGGPAAYGQAFAGTAEDAAPVEPLVLTWTLNRAVRAARFVLLRPWGAEWLGAAVLALALVGILAAARGAASLRLVALAFAPYLVAHALLQQAHTQRYAMPYVPAFALLAALGLDALTRRVAPRHATAAFVALAGVAAAASTAVALPGVAAYGSGDSPVLAALGAAGRVAAPPGTSLLSGHYMFQRYFSMAPPEIPLLPPRPRHEVEGLEDWWLAGGDRPVLFLAESRRTDLESIDPRAWFRRGRWVRPPAAGLLLSGERPDAVDLVELRPPRWFAGSGWGLSLEMASAEGLMAAERTAWLKPASSDALLLFAGEPTDALAAGWDGELRLGGRGLDRRSCGSPWMAAYALPASGAGGYVPLVLATSRGGVPERAAFALRGLAYGGAGEAMVVHGAGWHYPETAEDATSFRWASATARSLVNVPPAGARLVVEGEVPPRVPQPVAVSVESLGARQTIAAQGRFRLELDLPPGPPREVVLRAAAEFVPDAFQHNGDRRRLALKVDYYELSAR